LEGERLDEGLTNHRKETLRNIALSTGTAKCHKGCWMVTTKSSVQIKLDS